MNVYYDYEKNGIWQLSEKEKADSYGQEPGEIRVRDQNGDGKIDAQDRVILGQELPKFTGGITNRFSYKGFDLSIFLFARFGNTIYSSLHTDQNALFGRYNNLDVDYWTPDNATDAYPRPNENQEDPLYGGTMGYFDGSFIKIRSIRLAYTLPANLSGKIGARSVQVYVNAEQPYIFAPYVQNHKGIDPENPGTSTLAQRTFLLGLNITF